MRLLLLTWLKVQGELKEVQVESSLHFLCLKYILKVVQGIETVQKWFNEIEEWFKNIKPL